MVIWADPTVPDRIASALEQGADAYPSLLAGARKLRDLGAGIAAMPCNTAHFYLDRLTADTGLPFVDMVAETVSVVTSLRSPHGRVGLLATRATLGTRLEPASLMFYDLASPRAAPGSPEPADHGPDSTVVWQQTRRTVTTAVDRTDPGAATAQIRSLTGTRSPDAKWHPTYAGIDPGPPTARLLLSQVSQLSQAGSDLRQYPGTALVRAAFQCPKTGLEHPKSVPALLTKPTGLRFEHLWTYRGPGGLGA